ncbi:hypothetical protein N9J72_01955 [Candidatus Gracilibacteria bacterium]|nr:hypothetical protein [Candidatus Gracilibacteria bacterium]
MKAFFTLAVLVFLVGCTAEAPGNTETDVNQEQVVQDMDQETELLPDSDELIDDLINDVSEVIEDEGSIDTETPDATDETQVDDAEEIDETAQESTESEVVELSTTYNNPKMEVVMDIEYNLDSEGKITEIEVTSPNYDGMPDFNSGVQPVVGMTVSEASEYYVSGSSLTTPAFQAALKETL